MGAPWAPKGPTGSHGHPWGLHGLPMKPYELQGAHGALFPQVSLFPLRGRCGEAREGKLTPASGY